MKVDTNNTKYHIADDAKDQFNRREMTHLRFLLRRLRFLETKIEETGGMEAPEANGGATFAEMELQALEYILLEVGFLADVPA